MSAPATRGFLPVAIATLGGLYITQSILGGFIWTTLPAYMREQGLALDKLGFLSLLVLPWALKVFWSPWIEEWRRPADGRVRTKSVIALGGILVLLAMASLALTVNLLWMIAALFIVATATATVDIACDGHAVEAIPESSYGWANMMQVGGAYIGAAIGGGLVLVALDRFGWNQGIGLLIILCLVASLPFLLLRQPRPTAPPAIGGPSLRAALQRPQIRRGLLVTALYVAAMKASLGFFGPFLVDNGFSLSDVGLFGATGSLVAGLAGALLGGIVVARFGTMTVLLLALTGQVLVLLYCLGVAMGLPLSLWVLGWMIAIGTSAWLALGFVALYARFMEWSDPGQAGVDFTLFQCMDAGVGMLLGVLAGQIAERAGYSSLFGICLILSAMCGFGIYRSLRVSGEARMQKQ